MSEDHEQGARCCAAARRTADARAADEPQAPSTMALRPWLQGRQHGREIPPSAPATPADPETFGNGGQYFLWHEYISSACQLYPRRLPTLPGDELPPKCRMAYSNRRPLREFLIHPLIIAQLRFY